MKPWTLLESIRNVYYRYYCKKNENDAVTENTKILKVVFCKTLD